MVRVAGSDKLGDVEELSLKVPVLCRELSLEEVPFVCDGVVTSTEFDELKLWLLSLEDDLVLWVLSFRLDVWLGMLEGNVTLSASLLLVVDWVAWF